MPFGDTLGRVVVLSVFVVVVGPRIAGATTLNTKRYGGLEGLIAHMKEVRRHEEAQVARTIERYRDLRIQKLRNALARCRTIFETEVEVLVEERVKRRARQRDAQATRIEKVAPRKPLPWVECAGIARAGGEFGRVFGKVDAVVLADLRGLAAAVQRGVYEMPGLWDHPVARDHMRIGWATLLEPGLSLDAVAAEVVRQHVGPRPEPEDPPIAEVFRLKLRRGDFDPAGFRGLLTHRSTHVQKLGWSACGQHAFDPKGLAEIAEACLSGLPRDNRLFPPPHWPFPQRPQDEPCELGPWTGALLDRVDQGKVAAEAEARIFEFFALRRRVQVSRTPAGDATARCLTDPEYTSLREARRRKFEAERVEREALADQHSLQFQQQTRAKAKSPPPVRDGTPLTESPWWFSVAAGFGTVALVVVRQTTRG